jgi:hypothetical protein
VWDDDVFQVRSDTHGRIDSANDPADRDALRGRGHLICSRVSKQCSSNALLTCFISQALLCIVVPVDARLPIALSTFSYLLSLSFQLGVMP